jgi:glycosyltransferase involved in cell wall biosynthesis
MTLSFLVTVHNEDSDLDILLEQLVEYKLSNTEDEIVVLDDYSDNPKTLEIFEKYIDHIHLVRHHLNKDFGAHKQFGNEHCKGNFIMQVDADEYFSDGLLENLKSLISANPSVELFLVPRINIIRGMTEQTARMFGWEISQIDGISCENIFHDNDDEYLFLKRYNFIKQEKRITDNQVEVVYNYPIINWKSGDYQYRFYKNDPAIKWTRPLHELIEGAKVMTQIPREPNLALIHDKSMDRQIKQNQFYMSEFSPEMNVRK